MAGHQSGQSSQADGTPSSLPGKQQVRNALEDAKELPPVTDSKAGDTGKGRAKKKRGRPRSRMRGEDLVTMVSGEIELWKTPDNQAFATIPVNGHLENSPVSQLGDWLIKRAIDYGKPVPGSQAVNDALATFKAKARYGSLVFPVHLRVAEGPDGTLYIDLGNADWEVVKVTPEGWSIITDPPIKFARSNRSAPLPRPMPNGKLSDLRSFLNLPDDNDESWCLTLAWLLMAMRPSGGHPILMVSGEQGSAKTTFTRVLRRIVDDSRVMVSSMPANERDFFVAAINTWVMAFDNLSFISAADSDTLCKIATGTGYGTRRLHTDDEEMIFEGERPVILNGITELSHRPDLTDRSINLDLPSIPPDKREGEKAAKARFDAERPYIFGALLDVLSGTLAHLDDVELQESPRMYDFAQLGVAMEQALGWEEGTFLTAYQNNILRAEQATFENNPFAVALLDYVAKEYERKGDTYFSFTPEELLETLDRSVDEATRKIKAWPKAANKVRGNIKRTQTLLRSRGVDPDQRYLDGKHKDEHGNRCIAFTYNPNIT
ncbi:hypothetical protein [Fodinicurvata sediminis]|uniref:hypothetical protein n=1 Tax=Fodinicurvata sediminis TaxID=1121832 RepID=UPI0003B6CFEE|nr:hypothetical protein [Fodinicurvata sediminis]